MDLMTGAIVTALEKVVTSIIAVATAVVPMALPVIGIGIVVTIGIKLFKRVTSKA